MDSLYALDLALFQWVNGRLSTPLFDAVMPIITDQTIMSIPLVCLGLGLLILGKRKGWVAVLLVLIAVGIGDGLCGNTIKHAVERERPCHVLDDDEVNLRVSRCGGRRVSFPSNHALNSFSIATILVSFYPPWWPLCVLFPGAVAFSRVYVGVHYPADVTAGAILGIAVGALVLLGHWFVVLWIARRRGR